MEVTSGYSPAEAMPLCADCAPVCSSDRAERMGESAVATQLLGSCREGAATAGCNRVPRVDYGG